MRKINFFTKLFLAFVTISIIPLLFMGGVTSVWLTKTLQDSFTRQAVQTVAKISENIDILTSEYGEIIIGLIREDELVRKALLTGKTTDSEKIRSKLSVFARRRDAVIYLVNSRGTLKICSHPGLDWYNPEFTKEPEIFQRANALKNGYIIYPLNYISLTGDNVVYLIVRAVRDEADRPIGYVLVEIYKTHLETICNNFNTNLNLDIMIVDPRFYTLANLRYPKYDGTFFNFADRDRVLRTRCGAFISEKTGQRYLWVFHTSNYSQLITLAALPVSLILENSNYIRDFTFWASLGLLLVCLVLALLFTRSISLPIQSLLGAMSRVKAGDLSVRVELRRTDELGVLGCSFNSMVERLQRLIENVVEKQRQLRSCELRALQAQINPHFLYNTLDSIKWLAKLNQVPEISTIATQLGKLLRSSISCEADLITVGETMENIQSYLEIQKIRYSDKFKADLKIASSIYSYKIPKLILQPLVENAIIHGLDGKDGYGQLTINGYLDNQSLVFEVIDDGVGIPPEQLADLQHELALQSSQKSIGIYNVNRRIKLYYGDQSRLSVESLPGLGTKVTLRLPAVLEKQERENSGEVKHA
ncbi:MAG TPA: sensor histidine kinase [Bacillota bacterium]